MKTRQFFWVEEGNYVLWMPLEENCEFNTMFNCKIEDVIKIEWCLDENIYGCFGFTCIPWNPLRKYTTAEVIEDTPMPEICANSENPIVGNASYLIWEHPMPTMRFYSASEEISKIFKKTMKAILKHNDCETRYVLS